MDPQWIQAILSAVPAPLILVGADDRIVAANAAGEAILGPGQIGRHHALALRQPALLAVIEAALHAGARAEAPYVIPGPSQEVSYQVTVSPVRLGQMRGALCAFEDITEQELVGQFRRDFVANVSHELRTPLTTLASSIETLKGAARDDPPARERFLSIMEREAARMSRLVAELLSLSKVEAQERQRPTAPVDIAGLVDAAAASFRPAATEAGLRLEILGADGAPRIPGDADQLTQVLQNLIENAIKYGAAGDRVTIALHAPNDEPMLRIDVIDEGDGIEPMHLPRLTERFYRIDDHRSREKGGTGLGLAIVKHIVSRHRGRLDIVSAPGKGARFSVFLPKS
ncbi:GHKL domain-containing protein [Roseovarius spongiae]|uniref:histidine kinase n=1 Tax=Roseovarius spongiae TaxID=2320272 RepID=A0A3A8AWH4_9RHOB|nr:ATP-binding protein [Roseovarius spongiae]RKF16703.1 GHKL domain-containing protein [Roseovarius spongiae]